MARACRGRRLLGSPKHSLKKSHWPGLFAKSSLRQAQTGKPKKTGLKSVARTGTKLELEKNLVVHRLKDGRKHAQVKADKEVKRLKKIGKKLKLGMQKGKPKSDGIEVLACEVQDRINKVLNINLKCHEAA